MKNMLFILSNELTGYLLQFICITRENKSLYMAVKHLFKSSCDSTAYEVTGYRSDEKGSIPSRSRYFSPHHHNQTGSGAHPPVQWIAGAPSQEIKCN
jgi:hypothetical protein